MSKSSKKSRRHKNNHGKEDQKPAFFSKANDTPTNQSAFFQPKLTIGQPGDKYEKEADSMADSVVNHSATKPAIQQKEISNIQRVTLATPPEYEKLGTAEGKMEEDKIIQEMPAAEGEKEEEPAIQEMPATEGEKEEEPPIQEMHDPNEKEEPEAQLKEEEKELAQPKTEEEEPQGPLQTKSNTAAKSTASNQVTQTINQKKGRGTKLPNKTKGEMESAFGKDLSEVNIHTDQDAVAMNKELGAQAFTTGKDVFFNTGKFNPESSTGKHLLAHELTHVVQQGGNSLKKKPSIQQKLMTATSNFIQRLTCKNQGKNVGRRKGSDNPIDNRAQSILDYVKNSADSKEAKGKKFIQKILCTYFPVDAKKINFIKFGATNGGLEIESHKRGRKVTNTLFFGKNFISAMIKGKSRFPRQVMQVWHELRHLKQYEQGMRGKDRKNEREFLAFCEEGLGKELIGTGIMRKSIRRKLIKEALRRYGLFSDPLKKKYKKHQQNLLKRKQAIENPTKP